MGRRGPVGVAKKKLVLTTFGQAESLGNIRFLEKRLVAANLAVSMIRKVDARLNGCGRKT